MAVSGFKDALSLDDMLKEVRTIGGYANGDYVCECRECERSFIGDKRASQCLPCAVKALAAGRGSPLKLFDEDA